MTTTIKEVKTVSAIAVQFGADQKQFYELQRMKRNGLVVLKNVEYDPKTQQVILTFFDGV